MTLFLPTLQRRFVCVCVCVCSAIAFAKSHAEAYPYRISFAVFPAQKCGRWPVNTPHRCDLQLTARCLAHYQHEVIPLSVSQHSTSVVVSGAKQAERLLSVSQHSSPIVVSFTAFIACCQFHSIHCNSAQCALIHRYQLQKRYQHSNSTLYKVGAYLS